MKVQTVKVKSLNVLSYTLALGRFELVFLFYVGPTSNLTERRTSEKVVLGYGCKIRDT